MFSLELISLWLVQLFNQINARKINDELNVFKGIFRAPMFLYIWFIEVILQVSWVRYPQLCSLCGTGVALLHSIGMCIHQPHYLGSTPACFPTILLA